jgi:hypothetical protein
MNLIKYVEKIKSNRKSKKSETQSFYSNIFPLSKKEDYSKL